MNEHEGLTPMECPRCRMLLGLQAEGAHLCGVDYAEDGGVVATTWGYLSPNGVVVITGTTVNGGPLTVGEMRAASLDRDADLEARRAAGCDGSILCPCAVCRNADAVNLLRQVFVK